MNFIIVLAILSQANAGRVRDFCEKHLIADDPYQFESAPEPWLHQREEYLQIREAWGTLSRDEESELKIIRRELKRRRE